MIAIISDKSIVVKWLLLFQILVVILDSSNAMLYKCGWIFFGNYLSEFHNSIQLWLDLKIVKTKQWISVLKMTGVSEWVIRFRASTWDPSDLKTESV